MSECTEAHRTVSSYELVPLEASGSEKEAGINDSRNFLL